MADINDYLDGLNYSLTTYPASYRNMSRDEANGTVMIWATQFANDPVQDSELCAQNNSRQPRERGSACK